MAVVVRPQGLANTGENYRLECTVTEMDSSSTPSITWMNSDGLLASNSSGIFIHPTETSTSGTMATLSFSPLSYSHEDNYTCAAMIGSLTYTYTYPLFVSASKKIDFFC